MSDKPKTKMAGIAIEPYKSLKFKEELEKQNFEIHAELKPSAELIIYQVACPVDRIEELAKLCEDMMQYFKDLKQ